ATYTWTVDTQAPVVAISDGPATSSDTSSATFVFTADAPARCHVDDAPAAACASPISVAGLRDGTHTFVVEAEDAAGNLGSASYAWTIELPLPAVLIPAMPPSASASRAADFAFTVDLAAATTCALDGAAPAPCASP